MSKIVQKIGERFRDRLWPLSNMYEHKENGEIVKVVVPWGSFLCAESAYQAAKNPSVAKEFENLSGFDARKKGRASKTRADWFQVNVGVMRQVLEAKFQNRKLATFLASTEGQLVEYNEHGDSFWGQVFENGRWSGDNQLGRLLVELRNENRKIAMPETTDIFKTGAAVLVNPVNICGVMGAGLAKQFAKKFPDMLRDYKAYCEGNGIKISDSSNATMLDLAEKRYRPQGWLHVWHGGDKITIVNLATKIGWVRPSYLDLIQNGLTKLVDWVNEHKPESVAIPALGCGCGGLSWAQVYPAIVQAVKRFPANTKVWVNGKWYKQEEKKMENISLTNVRKYIPYATVKDIARLGVPPQDYAAFGFEKVVRNGEQRWVNAHIVIRDSSASSNVFEVHARWLNADNKLSGEGLAYVVAPTAAAAHVAFRNYIVSNCKKNPIIGDIFCRPFRGQELLMTGAVARCTRLQGDTTNVWFKKAVCREQQFETEADTNVETETKEETTMKNTNISNENNGNFEGNVSLDFFKPGCAKLEDDEPQQQAKTVKAAPDTVEYKPQTAWENAHDYKTVGSLDHVRNLYDDDNNDDNDTPPAPTGKVRKMPGVIAGLNVTAALAAGLTMAEAAQRMGEIRKLRAQLKALGKPGVEVKVPTRPQRVRGHKLDDAVTEYELFADFYKVLCEEFEAKYGVATPAIDNPLSADKSEVATVPEQKEISPDVLDTATADEKTLPEKPEDPKDDPDDPEDPEEPSNDNGNAPTDDNNTPTSLTPDGGDNNNDGTGAASNVAAASADQEVNVPDFCDEESVPPTPEELYGDALRVLSRNGNAQTLETVLLMLHRERKLYVDLDGDGIEIDDESYDWVVAQLAQHIAAVESSYTGGGFYEEADFSDALKAEQEAKTAASSTSTTVVVDPEPQPAASALHKQYESLLLQYCKFHRTQLNPDVLSPEQIAAEKADYERLEREQLAVGVQMLATFFGDDTARATASLNKAVSGYDDRDMTVKNRYQRLTYGKRCPLRKIFGFRQDKRGNFYVKGDRGKVRNDWMRATIVDGIGFVFEAAPQGTSFFR